MRWGAKDRRSRAADWSGAAAATVAAVLASGLSTLALADILELKPILGLEQIFTDNVRASSVDRDFDGITLFSAKLEGKLTTRSITAALAAEARYEEFWATNTLDNLNGSGIFAGRAEILDRLLFIDGVAEKSQVYLSPEEGSVSGVTTGAGSIELESYRVGPYITMDLFGLADLRARGTYGQVQFDKPVVGFASTLLTDIEVKHATAKITTGDRSSRYELMSTAEYMETDTGFEMRNVVGGVFLNLTPGITAIGRLGYEHISDPAFPLARGTIWSVGARYETGHHPSFVTFEYGNRFDDVSYRGEIHLQLTPLVHFITTYSDTLTPIQLTLVRSLSDLFNEDGELEITLPTKPALPDPLIVDTIVRDREFDMKAKYTLDLTTYSVTIEHSYRFYPTLADDEKTFFVVLSVEEQLSRRLSYTADVEYGDSYDTVLARPSSQIYAGGFSATYLLDDNTTFTGGYAGRLRSSPGGVRAYENVVRFGVAREF